MGTLTASSLSREASNYDEVSMQQSLLFSDSLKDLKNLRSQLYSAAEYFELSYTNDDQKQIVVETLKDYAIKALVNTVDHLGSVTYKVNDLLDEKVDEVSGTEFRVSCIEQRLRTCQEYIDHEGISQQSLVIDTPKYPKRYILPVGETMHGMLFELQLERLPSSARETPVSSARETPTSLVNSTRKGRSPSPSPRPPPQRSATFSFTSTMPKKDLERRSISPHRFPLLRSGSVSSRPVSSRPTTPNTSRPTTPSSAPAKKRSLEKSASMRLQAEKENSKDIEQYPSKSKRLLKALLSRRKSKKDEMLYTYLDEY
ncbi:hypothetical protein OIU78_017320 [Salix suchowensis]|nr:hypothetical protein OIU78_017320 [Salix suchowensis]